MADVCVCITHVITYMRFFVYEHCNPRSVGMDVMIAAHTHGSDDLFALRARGRTFEIDRTSVPYGIRSHHLT